MIKRQLFPDVEEVVHDVVVVFNLESVNEAQVAPVEAGKIHRAFVDEGVHAGM